MTLPVDTFAADVPADHSALLNLLNIKGAAFRVLMTREAATAGPRAR